LTVGITHSEAIGRELRGAKLVEIELRRRLCGRRLSDAKRHGNGEQ
jgi:hypothetical protein